MARYTGPVCRLCRREGIQLFLKGEKCYTEKCPLKRRPYPPGQHGPEQARGVKMTEYARQLRMKQRIKRFYGVLERQFRRYFEMAQRMPGLTGANLLILLERRLDNVLCRVGFAVSRAQARQMITHGHIFVNGRKVTIPSYLLKKGDVITVRQKPGSIKLVRQALQASDAMGRVVPEWLERDPDNLVAKVVELPTREQIREDFEENLVVELYSK